MAATQAPADDASHRPVGGYERMCCRWGLVCSPVQMRLGVVIY
jgi:hypothetical protein